MPKNKIKFVDFFAGAGGFSEGFLQCSNKNKKFEFVFASDINRNCELTHEYRYNKQLGLGIKFLTKDITDSDFLNELESKLGNNISNIDVVTGGPPCQSFSLAGRRRKFDKKDELFSKYLEVIELLRPKYFVMENVMGMLTKDNGRFKDEIKRRINSIIDRERIPDFLTNLKQNTDSVPSTDQFKLELLVTRLQSEADVRQAKYNSQYIQKLDSLFKSLTSKLLTYSKSKSNENVNTIRHGIRLLSNWESVESLGKMTMNLKSDNDIDNDHFVEGFDSFLYHISGSSIIKTIKKSLNSLGGEFKQLVFGLDVFLMPIDECLNSVIELIDDKDARAKISKFALDLRLYQVGDAFSLNASDYGVPQDRMRAIFIANRNDQKPITEIPKTVTDDTKVTVYEALHDLNFLKSGERVDTYLSDINKNAVPKRDISGGLDNSGISYAEWSRNGRLNGEFAKIEKYYTTNGQDEFKLDLPNHEASNHSDVVIRRLEMIRRNQGYENAKEELKREGVSTKKRNYNYLNPESTAPTIVTMPDDYVHYDESRAPSVREMARLQSFDDSFVFQGKRTTGGNRRKDEVPQYTLVGNAVPPLLARAIGMEILKKIK